MGSRTAGEPLTFASDNDGVLYQFEAVMRADLVENCGFDPARLIPLPTYDLEATWGITTEFLLERMTASVRAGRLFWQGERYEDALEAMHRVRAAGHRIVIVTARDLPGIEELCLQASLAWLGEHGFPFDEVILSRRKHEVHFDLLVDDCPANVESVLAAGKRAVLLDRPWNAGVAHLPMASWPQVPDLLEQIAAEGLAA